MKYFFLPFLFFLGISTVKSQIKMVRSVTTVLEKYENKWQHWGGDAETISFAAVKYVSDADSTVTMQIRVTNKDWEKTSMSSGAAFGGGNSWAIGISSTEMLQKRTGLIVFTKPEAQALYDFENEMFVKSNQTNLPVNETTWSLTFGDRFVVSATYDGKWKHTWTIDDARFQIPDFEVLPMFKKLKSVLNLL
ncbi:MAG: hypothetical protein LCH81_09615 [Bacteroidetes bacterium]|nr:hypothetical protein [Bacteroidota bacterium]